MTCARRLAKPMRGLYLAVFFIYKPGHLARIVSARHMGAKERRRYEQR